MGVGSQSRKAFPSWMRRPLASLYCLQSFVSWAPVLKAAPAKLCHFLSYTHMACTSQDIVAHTPCPAPTGEGSVLTLRRSHCDTPLLIVDITAYFCWCLCVLCVHVFTCMWGTHVCVCIWKSLRLSCQQLQGLQTWAMLWLCAAGELRAHTQVLGWLTQLPSPYSLRF